MILCGKNVRQVEKVRSGTKKWVPTFSEVDTHRIYWRRKGAKRAYPLTALEFRIAWRTGEGDDITDIRHTCDEEQKALKAQSEA